MFKGPLDLQETDKQANGSFLPLKPTRTPKIPRRLSGFSMNAGLIMVYLYHKGQDQATSISRYIGISKETGFKLIYRLIEIGYLDKTGYGTILLSDHGRKEVERLKAIFSDQQK
jgi:hypothetical protein